MPNSFLPPYIVDLIGREIVNEGLATVAAVLKGSRAATYNTIIFQHWPIILPADYNSFAKQLPLAAAALCGGHLAAAAHCRKNF